MTKKWYGTLRHPKMHPHIKFGIPTSKSIVDMHRTRSGTDGLTDRHFITMKTKSEVKVTVTRKWYATLRHPKMHRHTKFGIPTSKNLGDMHWTRSGTDGRTDRAITICLPKFLWGHKKIGYSIYELQQTACLVVKPIAVCNFAFLINCTPVGRTSDSMTVLT